MSPVTPAGTMGGIDVVVQDWTAPAHVNPRPDWRWYPYAKVDDVIVLEPVLIPATGGAAGLY